MAENLERLKQRIPLLEYLQRHNWKPCRAGARQEFVGLCPLHPETRPSFLEWQYSLNHAAVDYARDF